ncbi:MAG: thiamine pyrophosphate-dependent dehydrogenase E1 component subunit alpha [Chloroflexi bacterium]|nr:thiamine pyrophosphate-dependent dehydrogenase E1 component subunit alpha [Chloroflexota bacterium]MCL5075384.1 thiamine pyrophosphate-dependent dehydrogenase E1 component subunit alpha [Chloroflexota bacterium]
MSVMRMTPTIVTNEDLIQMFRDMCLIRSFETHLEQHFKKGEIPGFFHSGVGQEAVLAGVARALTSRDYFFPDHRGHGIIILKSEPHKIMAEIFGRSTGVCKGKGGSLHIADIAVGNLGNNGIQGSILATCLGPAVAAQIRKTDQVTAVFFGDGTIGRGEFHESLNMASVWKLPIVYLCVNNLYAISTPLREAHPVEDLVEMVVGYKIQTKVVNGNDIVAVYQATSEAVAHCRDGKGPYFLEFKTYRWQGHFSGDPASYRPAEELEYWKARDPIKRLREKCIGEGIATEAQLTEIQRRVDEEIEDMIRFAQESPFPALEEATTDIYVGRRVEGK